ncbi:MAG TPA: hypothetical protein VH025_02385 [Solirubrobacteraceae bacterium]|nr:hypothetical protein [Solirubrobacteraceae bacterium]
MSHAQGGVDLVDFTKDSLVASDLRSMAYESGLLAGLAVVIYLVAARTGISKQGV